MPQQIKLQKSRLAIIYLCIMAAFAVIILRMFFVVFSGDKVKVGGIYDVRKAAKRGNIYDRNHTLVATDLKTKSLYISSILVKNSHEMATELNKIFPELSIAELTKKINEKSKQWILIRRNLIPSQVEQVQNLKMAGLLFEDDRIRIYPQKSIASHLIGYVDLDRKGLAGVEMQYNKDLNDGKELQLAMDVRVQDILHDELVNGIEEFKAKAAAGLVMDVNNGEVLAISSIPDFDPNLQHEASSEQRFNRVITGVFEPGSIFKIFTNALAFEENLVKVSDVFNVREPIKYGRFTIKDDHPFKDEMTVEEIFSHSSNIGTVQIAKKFSIDDQKNFLDKIGMLKKVPTDFPGLGRPIYPKIWRDINLYTVSYGHGIAITPLHIIVSVAAMVNGGTLYSPSFLKLNKAPSGKKVISQNTSEIMKSLLRNTVLNGTGRFSNIEGYEVGGKTGTANRAEMGGYNESQTMASFVAVFPMSQPKYLVYVIFDRPNYSFNTGGMVASPVAGRVIKGIAPILGIRPTQTSQAKEKYTK